MRPNCSLPRSSERPLIISNLNLFFNPVKLSVRFSYLVFNEHSFCFPLCGLVCTKPHVAADTVGWWAQCGRLHLSFRSRCRSIFSPLPSRSLVSALVGSSGVEPPTSCLSGMRSNLLSYEPVCLASLLDFLCLCFFSAFTTILPIFRSAGGDEGNRTLDPLLAGQVLSQLSYTPIFMGLLTVPENRTTNSSFDFVLVVFLFSL